MFKALGSLLISGCILPSTVALAAVCPDSPQSAQLTAYCGVSAPEDLENLDNRFLLISSMAPARHLYGLEIATGALEPLETSFAELSTTGNWADPSCEPPGAMVSHGIDLSQRADGRTQLLVVNHGDRESVEFFEVMSAGSFPSLRWRGCVMAAENAQFNDLASLPDGGFLATDPITASLQLPRMLLGAMGVDTGQVYRWRPGSGYTAVAGTAGAYPNGILMAEGGRSFYLNLYLDNEVREHDLETGELLRSVALEKPDNLSLAPDGRILVASHDASVPELIGAITSAPETRIDIPFTIYALDPGTFEASVLFASDGSDLGGGTVAQLVGSDLYIGAFRGDRVLRVRVDGQ